MLRKIQRVGKRATKFQYTATYQSVVVECLRDKWWVGTVCLSVSMQQQTGLFFTHTEKFGLSSLLTWFWIASGELLVSLCLSLPPSYWIMLSGHHLLELREMYRWSRRVVGCLHDTFLHLTVLISKSLVGTYTCIIMSLKEGSGYLLPTNVICL